MNSGFRMALLFSGTAVGLEPKGRVDVPLGCGSLRAELCGSVQWSVAYTLFTYYIIYYIIYYIFIILCYIILYCSVYIDNYVYMYITNICIYT